MTEIIEFAPTGYEEAAAKERSLSPGRRRQRARRELKREYLGHVYASGKHPPAHDYRWLCKAAAYAEQEGIEMPLWAKWWKLLHEAAQQQPARQLPE